jgi:Zn finger protein HypA/HybF involved in hydrogenase expression
MMTTFMTTKYKNVRVVDYGHDFSGPYNDRKLKTTSWVEFSNNDTAKHFLKTATKDNAEISVEGTSVKIKPARTELQKKRNYALISASERLQKCPECGGKTVKIEWQVEHSKDRHVTVDKVVAFCQNLEDISGVWRAPYSALGVD